LQQFVYHIIIILTKSINPSIEFIEQKGPGKFSGCNSTRRNTRKKCNFTWFVDL